jgi:signal transduction histidine kinase
VLDQIDYCMAEARREIIELRGGLDDSATFEDRLRLAVQAAAGPALNAVFASAGPPAKLAHDVEKHLIRIAQEAVANAARHARATSVTVNLEYGPRIVRLQTVDDGAGMTPGENANGHFGIAGMRERAKLLGGTFSLNTGPEQGTRIEVVIPTKGRA